MRDKVRVYVCVWKRDTPSVTDAAFLSRHSRASVGAQVQMWGPNREEFVSWCSGGPALHDFSRSF